jgi:hypothetical protein
MPAIAPLSVNDGKATPVAHVFSPVTTDGVKAKFANRSASTPAGYEKLELELREPKSGAGAYRLIGKVTRPIMQTVNGVDTVVRTSTINFDINFPQSSSAGDRKDDLAIVRNILAHANVVTMAENLEPIY